MEVVSLILLLIIKVPSQSQIYFEFANSKINYTADKMMTTVSTVMKIKLYNNYVGLEQIKAVIKQYH